MVRVRSAAGALKLINARETNVLPAIVRNATVNLDEGMVLVIGETVYQGSEALHRLALMSSRSGIMNRWHYWLFRSRWRSRRLYPIFKGIRNSILWMLRIPRIENTSGD